MSARPLSGSITAIVTPMHDSGAVDHQSFARLVDYQVSGGSAGLVIGGSTGESVTLGDDELLAMIRDARSGAGQHLLLVAGAGSSSTAHAVQRARQLSSSGVDALLVATPAYNRPTQEGLYRHFAAIAAESTLPVILYNVPSRTAVDLLPATVARLAQLPRIVGIKEAVPSMERIRELVSLCGSGFTVLSGDDPTARDAVANGARGVISVTANVAPAGMSAMIAAALRGESAEAARIDHLAGAPACSARLRAQPHSLQVRARPSRSHGRGAAPAAHAALRRAPAPGGCRVAQRGSALRAAAQGVRLMSSPLVRWSLRAVLVSSFTLLAGCGLFRGSSCAKPGAYMQSKEVAPLRIPDGLDAAGHARRAENPRRAARRGTRRAAYQGRALSRPAAEIFERAGCNASAGCAARTGPLTSTSARARHWVQCAASRPPRERGRTHFNFRP